MNPQRTASAEYIRSIQPPLNQGGARPEITPDIELPCASPDRAEVIPLQGGKPVPGLVGRPGIEPGAHACPLHRPISRAAAVTPPPVCALLISHSSSVLLRSATSSCFHLHLIRLRSVPPPCVAHFHIATVRHIPGHSSVLVGSSGFEPETGGL